VEVTGRDGFGRFQYDLWLAPDGDAPDGSAIERTDGLTVVIPPASVEVLRGAVLNRSGDLETGGLVIEESAQASPDLGPPPEHLTGDTAQRVQQVLERQINPAIAAHGGVVHLVNVEDGVAFVRMGGGCAGCGMAGVTLDQGIELAIRQAVPEITGIVDVTDHAAGQNPYYVPTA
jgi:Fe/S biogenesis protein NfuA